MTCQRLAFTVYNRRNAQHQPAVRRATMSVSDAQQKMIEARDLIKNKRYAEARKILETVDHPKAKEWLTKLDEIELGDPFDASHRITSLVKPEPTQVSIVLPKISKPSNKLVWELLALVILLIIG